MTIAYTWTITQCDSLTSDGFITCAHWTASAVDGDYNASIYSTCSWAAGTVIFDTTLAKLCVYSGSAWQTITSV